MNCRRQKNDPQWNAAFKRSAGNKRHLTEKKFEENYG